MKTFIYGRTRPQQYRTVSMSWALWGDWKVLRGGGGRPLNERSLLNLIVSYCKIIEKPIRFVQRIFLV